MAEGSGPLAKLPNQKPLAPAVGSGSGLPDCRIPSVFSMRFVGILFLVFTVLALGAVERTVFASGVSAPDTISVSLAKPDAHVGHVATHKAAPESDMSSMLCKILCALAMSQLPLAMPNGFDSWLQIRATILAAGNIESDEVAPSLDLPPPR